MKKLLLAFAVVVATALTQAQTVINNYALVSAYEKNGPVYLYKVSDDGTTWTYQRTIRARNDGHTTYAVNAVCKKYIVYVVDTINESDDTSDRYIRKYALDGSGYIGDLVNLGPRRATCLCLSSDGKFLYVGYTFSTHSGKIDKISLGDGSITRDFATGLGQFRQLAVDGKGHLLAANRGGKTSVIDESTGTVVAEVDNSNAQGIAYDATNDLFWWRGNGGKAYGTLKYDGSQNKWVSTAYSYDGWNDDRCFAVAVYKGIPYFGSSTASKVYRRASDGTFTFVKDENANDYVLPSGFGKSKAALGAVSFFSATEAVHKAARVYLTFPASGVKVYRVDNQNEWISEGVFVATESGKLDRPVAFLKAGEYFYACDQHADSQLGDYGYFSIVRYDSKGHYVGKLVDKYEPSTLGLAEKIKADNMTASPNGDYLYVSCFNGGVLFRVSTANGQVEKFATDGISVSRGCCVAANGNVYVANRNAKVITVYNSTDGKKFVTYGLEGVSGAFVDDVAREVYGTANNGNGLVFTIGSTEGGTEVSKADTAAARKLSGCGNCMAVAKVNHRIVLANWDGKILEYNPNTTVETTTPRQVLSDLGNMQHIYVENFDGNIEQRGLFLVVQ